MSYCIPTGGATAICLTLIPMVGGKLTLLKVLLCLTSAFCGCITASDVPLASEMTIHFPSTLYGLFNMISMSTGFVVPDVVGWILDSYSDPTAGWPLAFYAIAALCVCATLVFLLFAEAERQEFDYLPNDSLVRGKGRSDGGRGD